MDIESRPIVDACRRALWPIARWLLRSGVTFKEFAELARRVFVAVATEEFGLKGRPTNVSRVALMTGLTRREVRLQRAIIDSAGVAAPDRVHHATRVLTSWHLDPDFVDSAGNPLVLREDGDVPSFEALLKRNAGDIPPRALGKELLRAGCVERTADGTYRALSRTYIPQQLDSVAVMRAGDVLADLATTVEFNVRGGESEKRLERRAHNRRVDPKALPEFRALIEREGQALLERVDDWLSAHELPETHSGRAVRLGLGMYQITQAEEVGEA